MILSSLLTLSSAFSALEGELSTDSNAKRLEYQVSDECMREGIDSIKCSEILIRRDRLREINKDIIPNGDIFTGLGEKTNEVLNALGYDENIKMNMEGFMLLKIIIH